VVAAIVALLAVGGGAYAAGSNPAGDAIVACVHQREGELYRASRCARGDTQLRWMCGGYGASPEPEG
jgi:hypothetical protein